MDCQTAFTSRSMLWLTVWHQLLDELVDLLRLLALPAPLAVDHIVANAASHAWRVAALASHQTHLHTDVHPKNMPGFGASDKACTSRLGGNTQMQDNQCMLFRMV